PTGYAVPGHQPRGASGSNPVGGVIAPYGAGMAVLWEPNDAISALRHMKGLSINGKPVWTPSGHGFVDAFNVDENWTSPNLFGIANGPMLLCIENARTGMIWNLFHSNQHIADGMLRAGFVPVPHGADGMSVYFRLPADEDRDLLTVLVVFSPPHAALDAAGANLSVAPTE